MNEETYQKNYTRRDYLKTLGATGLTTTTAGCSALGNVFGSGAGELEDAVNQTETALKNELPWNDYKLGFEVENLNLDLENLGPTGVENANQYAVEIEVDLSPNSDDLEGWMATNARRAEFFGLYAPPSYDMLLETYDNLEDFTVPNQPSHRNQIVEYTLHMGASDCSYIEDNIAAAEIGGIVENPRSYLDYLDNGDAVTVNIEDAFLGIDFFC